MSNQLAIKLEATICPLCEESQTETVSYALVPYKVVQCSACKMWYLNPRMNEEQMLSLYADDNYFHSENDSGYSAYQAQRDNLKATFARFLRQLSKSGYTGGRLLEVGAGYGFLLEEATAYFSYCAGTDYSQVACERLSKVCDKVYQGGIEQIPESEKFDLIITVGVIEHIYTPLEFNRSLLSHLHKGGRLVHATPHMGSLWRKVMGTKWPSFKVPEHVSYFDPSSLNNLFIRTGFSEMEVLAFPHRFSLALVGQKLGLGVGKLLGGINVWLPATTIAMIGKNDVTH